MVRAGPAAQATSLGRKSTKGTWTNLHGRASEFPRKYTSAPAKWSGCGGVSPVLWTHDYFNDSSDGLVSRAQDCELRELVANRKHPNDKDLQDQQSSTTTSGSLTTAHAHFLQEGWGGSLSRALPVMGGVWLQASGCGRHAWQSREQVLGLRPGFLLHISPWWYSSPDHPIWLRNHFVRL